MSEFAKDFDLVTLDLYSSAGERNDLRYTMLEINVFEDVFSNNTTGNVLVTDANNMLNAIPIFGGERLVLEFRTPDRPLYSREFVVTSISDRSLLKERQQAYVLHFVTPEAITNLKTKVSKSYKGKLLSDIVIDLHTEWLGSQELTVEPTQFQHHVIIPNLHPAHAVNWLCTRASSTAYEGASYLYYQDRDSYRFETLEGRLEQPSSQTYLWQPQNIRDDGKLHKPRNVQSNLVSAQSYTIDHHSDVLDNLRAGMYGNTLLTHSLAKKRWARHTFDYVQSFDQYRHLYPGHPLHATGGLDLVSADSRHKLHTSGHDLDGYPFLPDQWLPCRLSQLQQLHNVKLTLTVPGDSDRTVGQVVESMMPSPEPPVAREQVQDKYYAGRYLVQALRHKIDQNTYTTTLELTKDSTFQPLP